MAMPPMIAMRKIEAYIETTMIAKTPQNFQKPRCLSSAVSRSIVAPLASRALMQLHARVDVESCESDVDEA